MLTPEKEINIDLNSNPTNQWGVNMTIFAPTGQSFTAVSHHIRFIGMYVGTSPNIPPVQFQLLLLEGAGTSDPVVGIRYATAPQSFLGFLYFDFSGTRLTVGKVYTAVIAQDPPVSAQNSSELFGTTNVYTGGTAFLSGGAIPSEDSYLRVLHVIYSAQVQPPLKADGSSIIPRGEHVQVKFTLEADGASTCDLPRAKLSLSPLKETSTVLLRADFHIHGCEYIYNLATEALTAATPYQIMILIHDIEAGSVIFSVQ